MKNHLIFIFFTFFSSSIFAQVGINTVTPASTLDLAAINPTGVSTNVDGILVPRVDRQRAQSMTSIPNATLIYVNSIATGNASGISSNITAVGFYIFDINISPSPGKWVQIQTSLTGWTINGNASTNPSTNFIGTTDATDLAFRTGGTERMRINNSNGDIFVGDANSGTFKSNKELVMRQDGDVFGSSALRLRHRNAENGAIFDTSGSGPALVDFIFKTGPVATPIQSNIRFETRSAQLFMSSLNTNEWQFGQPGNPTLVVGAAGTGSNSFFRIGRLGIGTASPLTSVDITAVNPTGTSTGVEGLLIPRIDRQRAQSMTSIPNATMIYVNSISTGTATGIALNINSIGFYSYDTATSLWVRFQTNQTNWSPLGNAGTNPSTNFLGTTDAVDLAFRTGGTERMRINNSNGDISVGDANSGTFKSNKEFVMRQDGDTFGSSVLRLRNRNAENGAIFENLNPTPVGTNLVDFIFKTGTTAVPIQSNIRFETRSGSTFITTNSTEWQFGLPGNPTLVIGASGTGSVSAFRIGNVGIGTLDPKATLHNNGTTAFTVATSGVDNTVILQNAGIFSTPTANASTNGRVYIIRNTSTTTDTTVNNIIDYNVSTAANFALTPAIGSIMIVCDGTNWYRIK